MSTSPRTLYLWDLAGTLFQERWDPVASGYPTLEDYVRSRGMDPGNPREFEVAQVACLEHGEMFGLRLSEGYRETLAWTERNETFSTGVPEQVAARARYLNPKVGFDILEHIVKVHSTFDYGETNVKTPEMLVDYLSKKVAEGYRTVVYADDKLENCMAFADAARTVGEVHADFTHRLYHMRNDDGGLRTKESYCEVGSLSDILVREKTVREKA